MHILSVQMQLTSKKNIRICHSCRHSDYTLYWSHQIKFIIAANSLSRQKLCMSVLVVQMKLNISIAFQMN